MGYLFSGQQLEPGFQAESIDVPHLAVRVDLFGHHFTKHLSAQVTYMRPARFVAYNNVNGDAGNQQVSTAYAGLTLVWDVPLNDRVSAYGEGGWGVTSRSGFDIDGDDGAAARALCGRTARRRLRLPRDAEHRRHARRDLFAGPEVVHPAVHSTVHDRAFATTCGRCPTPRSKTTGEAGFAFPENVVRLGYTTNLLATASTTSSRRRCRFSGAATWRRGAASRSTTSATCSTRRRGSPSISARARRTGRATGTAKSSARSRCIRSSGSFWPAREPADVYFSYSLAGPTFVSRTVIDGRDTGERFTFQDFMGVGAFFGKTRRMNAELGIKHYSNGNIFTTNASIKVPLTLTLGLTF